MLTPEDFGYFALITAVTTILTSLSEAGLGSSVIQKKNADKDFTSTAFTLSLCFGFFFSGILFTFARQFSQLVCDSGELTLAFRIMSVMIFVQAANNITWATYMKQLNFFRLGILQICADIISYCIGIYFAWKGFGFYAIVASTISNHVCLTIIFIILKKFNFRIKIVKQYVKEIVGYGGWLTAAVILRNLTNEIDKVIIGRMLPITDLGAINRPQGFISRITAQVNGIFDTVLFPILSSIQDDSGRISRAYVKIVSLIFTLSLLMASIFSLGSKLIIDIFFGAQWEHLRPILIVFSLAMMVHGYSRIADSFFRSLGIVKRYFLARLINWAVFVTSVWIGCHFGILAVSLAMAFGSTVSCIIKYFMQRKAVKVSTAKLLKGIATNIAYPAVLLAVCLIIMFKLPYGDYIGLAAYLLIIVASMIFFPRLFGKEFRETVINRYLKFAKKLSIY